MERRNFIQTGLVLGASVMGNSLLETTEAHTLTDENFKKIKIAQIGVRHEHASGKMNTLKMLPKYYEIVGIAAESPEEQKKHEKDSVYKGLKWYSQNDLLKLPGLEAVAIETEMTELLPTAIRCAERGLHLHVDKPLGQSYDECKKMLDICREHKVIMQPGYMFRTNQAFRLLLKAVQKGWLGEVHDVALDMCRNDTSPSFRKWLGTYRGGGMYDFGSHLIDFVVELLGEPEGIQVFERPDPNDGLQDNTLSVLTYKKAIAEIRVSLRKIDGFSRRRLAAFGTKGSFVVDPIEDWTKHPVPPLNVRLTLAVSNEEFMAGTHDLKLDACSDRYIGQLTELAHYIRGTKKNPYSYEYELLVQKVILAASNMK